MVLSQALPPFKPRKTEQSKSPEISAADNTILALPVTVFHSCTFRKYLHLWLILQETACERGLLGGRSLQSLRNSSQRTLARISYPYSGKIIRQTLWRLWLFGRSQTTTKQEPSYMVTAQYLGLMFSVTKILLLHVVTSYSRGPTV